MKPHAYITTSWDDGHPLDLRVAKLLARYGLRGTFYVPKTCQSQTMTPAQLRELSGTFEIGAHTLHHVVLPRASAATAWEEIAGSRAWVEDNTGQRCRMFCPPKGKFSARDLGLIRKAGYAGARSVELLSLDFPRSRDGLHLLPTTLQAHPHGRLGYVRNVVRRGRVRNLWQFITRGLATDWPWLARSLLGRTLEHGGVFHLWGHSWELEKTGQWQRLEEVLAFLGQQVGQAPALTNGELCARGTRGQRPPHPAETTALTVPEDSVP